MKFVLASLFVVMIFVSGYAQEKDQRFRSILWANDKCYAESKHYIAAEKFLEEEAPTLQKCERILVDGQSFLVIFDNDQKRILSVAISLIDNYWVFSLYVVNTGQGRFDVDPKRAEVKYMDAKGTLIKIPATSPEAIARKFAKTATWANVFRSLGASLAQRTTTVDATTTGSIMSPGGSAIYTGQTTATITEPDRAAQNRAARENAATSARASSRGQEFLDTALLANTVFPDSHVAGNLYFKPLAHKNTPAILFTIYIGDTEYIYRYST
jgi:hypothetical protein